MQQRQCTAARDAGTASRRVRALPVAVDTAVVAAQAAAAGPLAIPAEADSAAVPPADADSAVLTDAVGRVASGRNCWWAELVVVVGEMCGVNRCFPTAGPAPPLWAAAPDTSAALASADGTVAVPADDSDSSAGLRPPVARPQVVAPETVGGDREDPHAMPPG